jgi:hypothetical protein
VIEFQGHDASPADGHPAPDPFLWGTRPLSACRGDKTIESRFDDNLDFLAELEFHAHREELQAIHRGNEIVGLYWCLGAMGTQLEFARHNDPRSLQF